jgi:AraC-like DNA-binding protein
VATDSRIAPQDALSLVLDGFRLRGSVSAQVAARSPWGFSVAAHSEFGLLVITRGRVSFDMAGVDDGQLELATGDVVAMPSGDAFTVRDRPDSPVVPITEAVPCSEMRLAMPGAQTEFIILRCVLSGGCSNPLRAGLPRLIHLSGSDATATRWLEPTVRLLALEAAAPATGQTTVLDRLAEVILVHLIRAWLDGQSSECGGWLRALSDPQLGRALAAFHAAPGRAWTIESLAAEAVMSRSAFAARFKALTHETPLEYVTAWRMRRAMTMIETGEQPLKSIVASLGYASEAAFRTAFKRHAGQTPGAYRATVRASASANRYADPASA